MNTINQANITQANEQQRTSIIALLQAEKLPVEDLPASLDNFLIATEQDSVIAAIGLEQYDNCGLLRSMVVSREHRNKNIASQLVQGLEGKAVASGIDCMYLLTETATQYFEKKGYERIGRNEVPKAIQGSSEFSSVCPVSAIVMKKPLSEI
jgi:amino-acid N-acetyltransferase